MNQIKIIWKKELKNCVPFFIYVDGQQYGIIKRGEEFTVNVNSDTAEIYFVPKAPKWFGWQALKLNVSILGEFSGIHLGVEFESAHLGSFVPQKLRNAANINNQLHCIDIFNIELIDLEYVKKYK